MDAICFVVGLSARQLRGDKLRDLVFGSDSRSGPKTASVTLVYLPDEGEVEGYDEGEEMRFTRSITASGSCGYRLNGEEMSADEYATSLAAININVKARNFLVFQGDVESIARKNPKEMMKHFEVFSGSYELKYVRARLPASVASTLACEQRMTAAALLSYGTCCECVCDGCAGMSTTWRTRRCTRCGMRSTPKRAAGGRHWQNARLSRRRRMMYVALTRITASVCHVLNHLTPQLLPCMNTQACIRSSSRSTRVSHTIHTIPDSRHRRHFCARRVCTWLCALNLHVHGLIRVCVCVCCGGAG